MRRPGDSFYTAELSTTAALASFELFGIMFFAIHQNMEPAQWSNTCWEKLTLKS
jgi:hypothetical protein